MPDKIRIILINTFHPGNIGAVARAMKTMGLHSLYLVNPGDFPASGATSMAAGAQDVLDNATVVNTFDEAIAECSLVIGTSARSRNMSTPLLGPAECAEKLVTEAGVGNVALVFGQETMGMTNEELLKCHYHVAIPANPDYPVLNVAAAAQILCYEIYTANRQGQTRPLNKDSTPQYPSVQTMEYFYTHLETTLDKIGFLIPQHPGLAMTRLKRLFNRARPEEKELNMLRGILSAIDRQSK
ncbi:tRNA (cytosine(32)/uridine(32)-2'-O)-methyltransferase TrmJ [Candidatus Sororendozoicomonas aggregata]|uniref:tRNA (cytosine(32)/uridine(32)-2'-O)-methyltransferase TrmJ n=1 Tax=Candidatus Sororendozoicomonas aggregata TaxID=3073239 RepID=UPI002ED319BB